MTERHCQLMARSAGTHHLSPQGPQIFPHASYVDTGAGDPYYAAGTHLNPARFGSRSDYYLPSDSQDIRAQLISERRSSLSDAFLDLNQPFVDHADHRMLSGRPGFGEIIPYPSPQRPGLPQSISDACGSPDLLQARRAEIVSAYGQAAGGRMRRLGSLDDPVVSKDGLMSAGACLNGPGRHGGSSYEDHDLTIPRSSSGQHGGLRSGLSARQGRDFEQYLLAVQPDKLVRYAAACLSPEPAIKRARYAMMANNVAPPPELDVYSNYRQAKLRRSGVAETVARLDNRTDGPVARPLGTSGVSRKEKESQPSRERRRKSDDRGRGSESPGRDNRNASSVPKGDHGNRVHQPRNSSQSSGAGKRFSGEKQGSAGTKRPSLKTEHSPDNGSKEENHVDSDKDSELGSLDAGLSEFEDEKIRRNKKTKKKVSEEPEAVIDAPLDGMIFGCSSVTFYECMRLQLFGLPSTNKDDVMRVAPGTKLFLFNFDTKELSGIFEAVSYGAMMIKPDAFREFGAFPAQVQVCCVEQCPNVHLTDFKPSIKDNFLNGFKFKFTLNASQVKDLIRLFRRAARVQYQQLHRQPQGGFYPPYTHERSPSEDYHLRNTQRRRQTYTQHPQASFGLSSISSARVLPLSTKSKVPEESSWKAPKGRKKKKVENACPKLSQADNCSSFKEPEEMGEADIARNASKTREDDDISNTNLSVVVRKVIVTDKSIEATDAILDSIGSDPFEPDHGIGTSKPLEFPGLQSDREDCDGKQVSLVEDSSNDGKCGLAGERREEQGKGLNVLKGALDNRQNVITKSSCTSPSSGVHEGLSTMKTPQPLVNLGSPLQEDVMVAGEVQSLDKVEISQVVRSYDSLDVEETKENQNSAAGCSASLPVREALESPIIESQRLLVDDPQDEDGDTVREKADDSMKAVETSSGNSNSATVTNTSNLDRIDQKAEGEKGTLEEVDTISSCEEGHPDRLVSQREEVREIINQQKRDDGGSCEPMNMEINSDKDVSDSCRSNDPISDTESMSPQISENAQMVDDLDYDIRCEIPNINDVVKVTDAGDSDLRKDAVVEQVIEVEDRVVLNDQDVKQVLEIDDDCVGEGVQTGKIQVLQREEYFVDCKLPKDNEEDVMDDVSSAEIPETSDSENEDEVGSAHDASSETPDEAEAEEEEQGLEVYEVSSESSDEGEAEEEEQKFEVHATVVSSSCERPKMDDKVVVGRGEKGISLPLSEAYEDRDVMDGTKLHEQRAQSVCHDGVKVDRLGVRSRCDDPELQSEEKRKTDADFEERAVNSVFVKHGRQ